MHFHVHVLGTVSCQAVSCQYSDAPMGWEECLITKSIFSCTVSNQVDVQGYWYECDGTIPCAK